MQKVSIDVSAAHTSQELHELLAEKLSFPSFYGKNWDAFWDAITGLVEMLSELEIQGLEALKSNQPEQAAQFVRCLKDMANEYPELGCKVRYV